MSYEHGKIEPKWQAHWDKKQLFRAEDPAAGESTKPKYYILDMFPYPSASGLHVGHPEGYTATDILARYKRAKGFNVLHPMGWDAFGLPAEQYAIQTGVHPEITTARAIDSFRRQLKSLGFSYDWSREFATCDPQYYKWTQFVFLKLYERGLAYQKEVPVNWCPALKTVLANEEVVDGKSERGGHPVYRQPMKQWMLKITDYAERLLQDLDKLDWPHGTKELQRNWIGKSEGLQAHFGEIEVFTTRPDTIFGVTYLVLAPEHPLVPKFTTPAQKSAVETYQAEASRKSEVARQDAAKDKSGVFTGSNVPHPITGKPVPVWVADYVMMGYGTGAIMAVPAHDTRDREFAEKFQLPIIPVVQTSNPEDLTGDGVAINSDFINGQATAAAKRTVTEWFEKNEKGKRTVQYKLRDWLFSRQRYWGEPFPILHLEDGTRQAVPADQLPVVLPAVESYEPSGTGESPLAGITDWLWTTDPITGKKARRETDTMPGSAGSSWYFLRYCDPHNQNEAWSRKAADYWMPVDLYLGGPEHAVGHLLYARFWTKVLFDAGLVGVDEPFRKLVHQGMILGEDGEKMSKSRGNVINPDTVVEAYGADTLRIYEMFMGPLERDKPWSTTAIEGVYRFLQRAYRMSETVNDSAPDVEDLRMLHKTIQKVTDDIEGLRFNTAVSQMMVFVNHFTKKTAIPKQAMLVFSQLLQPFAPHLCEEFWERLGGAGELSFAPWPIHDPQYVMVDVLTIAIQVLGKMRGTVEVPADATQADIEAAARKLPAVQTQLEGKTVKKVIYVPGKIMNWIVG